MKTEGVTEEISASSQRSATSETEDADTKAASLPSTSSQAVAYQSDGSNNEESAGCYICINKIITQEIGTTDVCNHSFCIACIQEWSKRANTCPVDRQEFNFIHVRNHLKGEIVRRIPVKPINQVSEDEDGGMEDLPICKVCGESDRQGHMLHCEFCNIVYHMDCLDPLWCIFFWGYWSCPDCNGSTLLYTVHMRMP
jgi:PHD and RING finger domain-containing protein 1